MKKSSRYSLYLMGIIFFTILMVIIALRISLELHQVIAARPGLGSLRSIEVGHSFEAENLFPVVVVNRGYHVKIVKADKFELLIDSRLQKEPVIMKGQLLFSDTGGEGQQDSYHVLIKLPSWVEELRIMLSDYSTIEVTDLSLRLLSLDLSNRSSMLGYGLVTQQLVASVSLDSIINFEQANPLASSRLNMSSGSRALINSDGVLTGSVTSRALVEYRGSSTPLFLESSGGTVVKISDIK